MTIKVHPQRSQSKGLKPTLRFKCFILRTDELFDSLKHTNCAVCFQCTTQHNEYFLCQTVHATCSLPLFSLKPKYRRKAHQCSKHDWHIFIRVELRCLIFIYFHLFIIHFRPLIISRLRNSYNLIKVKPYKIQSIIWVPS